MSSRVVRSRFAIASRYARKRSASETSFLMGRLLPDKFWPDRGHSSDLTPLAVAVHTAWTAPRSSSTAPSLRRSISHRRPLRTASPSFALRTLPCLPLPGGEVEVVAPGGDLTVADLEHAGARQLDPLVAEAEAVDTLGEDEVAARDEVDDLGLELLRG